MYLMFIRSKKGEKLEPDEESLRGTLWLKGRVNKDAEYPDDDIRSVVDKHVSLTAIFCHYVHLRIIIHFPYCVQKETEDKIKDSTLKVNQAKGSGKWRKKERGKCG